MQHSRSLPCASSLCGACYEVCPVKINIPEILVHLRAKVVEQGDARLSERLAMRIAGFTLANSSRLSAAQKLARMAQMPFERDDVIHHLPGMLSGWTDMRDLRPVPKQSFREWWSKRKSKKQ